MALISFKHELIVSGSDRPTGTQKTYSLTGMTQVHDQVFTLSTGTNKIILNLGSASTDDLADADFIYIITDQDVLIEFVGTTVAANSNLKLKANVPFILAYDDTLAYDAAGTFAGAAQNITKITIRNNSGTTLNGRIIAAT